MTEVTDALRETSLSARTRGKTEKLTFDLVERTVSSSAPISLIEIPGGVEMTLTTAQEQSTGANKFAVTFFANGQSTGGQIDITHAVGTQSLLVNWITGTVRIDQDFADE